MDQPRRVSDLIEEGQWKTEYMGNWMNQVEVQAIQKIPIPLTSTHDFWTWHYTKHGQYSVRSAYHVEKGRSAPNVNNGNQQNERNLWSKLWNAKVPPKARHFGWKVIHGAWYTDLLQHFKDEMWWNIFWSLTWGIWLRRNAWLFERKKPSIENTILKAMSWVGEYEKANEATTKLQQIEISSTKWLAPSQGVYKINSDMALLGNNLMGLGAVVRDWVGDVVLSSCWKVNEATSVEESEAMVVRHALTIAWEAGFREVIVEADCLKVIHHLKNKIQEPSTFGCIIADILAIAEQCNSFCFRMLGEHAIE
ncbi:hypothetical protein RDABS01_016629 [Bienertia sinuspersici]